VDKQQEVNEERDELTDLLKENGITEDDVLADLAELEAEMAEGELGGVVPSDEVKVSAREPEKVAVKKQVVAA
jgi:hypothetical protein